MASGAQGKNILLFSDGTGNSSGKLFKTNVWRMYEAVELGLSPTHRVQVAFYDNGVGTSKIKVLAWIAGIFGFGLQRNVRAIYKYVCRNYQPGDRVYCFGFSRGAYTIRIVAALLAKYGIVVASDENELEARTHDVMRAYQSKNKPNLRLGRALVRFNRAVRDLLIATKRAVTSPGYKIHTDFGGIDIQFIGVWDTVSAYGGPSAEVTRAIDNFIYPLSMTDQCLSERVQIARHALSLDDERDAFQPLLWDEWDWDRKARTAHPNKPRAQARFRGRLQQLWFAGVHSDVGGGYPDDSLSYVSLAWMMQEAAMAGVRLLPELRDRVFHMSNSLGPIHNSRGGLSSYYRYQPRRIEGFFHKKVVGREEFEETLTYRDPIRGERPYPPLGELLSCKVHESVAARIAFGTDGYAPIVLPPKFSIEPFNFDGAGGGNPRVDPAVKRALIGSRKNWPEQREKVYDRVWWRRVAYFYTVVVTAALVLMPLYAQRYMYPATTDGQWVFGRLTSWAKVFPGFLQPWVRAFQTSPWVFLILTILVAVGWTAGTFMERSIRSKMRKLWLDRVNDRKFGLTDKGWVESLRTAKIYQRLVQSLKWYGLPSVIGFVMLLGILYVFVVIVTQLTLSAIDPRLCKRTAVDPSGLPTEGQSTFDASKLCNQLHMQVRTDEPYSIELAVPTTKDAKGRIRPDWNDGPYPTSPNGLPAYKLGFAGSLGALLRRLVDARYMQLIYQIRPINSAGRERHPVLVHALDFTSVDKSRPQCWIYRADFVAHGPGELAVFANDSIAVWDRSFFYTDRRYGNHGTGIVYLHELHALGTVPEKSAALDPDPCRLGAGVTKK